MSKPLPGWSVVANVFDHGKQAIRLKVLSPTPFQSQSAAEAFKVLALKTNPDVKEAWLAENYTSRTTP